MTGRRVARALVGLLGVVAITTGAVVFLGGPEAGTDGSPVPASVDTEFRFFSAFWIGLGVFALRTALRGPVPQGTLAAVTGALFLGGVGRILSLADAGRPHALFLVLMAIELAAPAVLLLNRGDDRRLDRPEAG
jgi:hypothetical protein